jgi:uracil-DNA glycosylase
MTAIRSKSNENAESQPLTLATLHQAEAACRRCPLYKDATQAVPGEGRAPSQIMLIGAQPGDNEDLAGKPFVGPAGRILDEALALATSGARRFTSPTRSSTLNIKRTRNVACTNARMPMRSTAAAGGWSARARSSNLGRSWHSAPRRRAAFSNAS